MIGKWLWMLRSVLRRLWVRVGAFAVLAIATAASAPALAPTVPDGWTEILGSNAVDQVLGILASSMLAVTTFSLSIAVNAFTAAAGSATPRAIALLQEDHTTQTTLATFLGAFVYSIVAIIGLNAGYYSDGGRFVLFASTVIVVGFVVVALLRWIAYLPDFGRMQNTLNRVEEAARDALTTRLAAPFMGGHASDGSVPDGSHGILSQSTGYVQHVDMQELQDWAEDAGAQIWLAAFPGDFVHPATPLVHVLGDAPDDRAQTRIRDALTIERARTFDQDPRFGMIVFAEIASRAVSPGINDPGTAIAVIGRQLAVLAEWTGQDGPEVDFPRLHVAALDPAEMLDLAFRGIARDGRGMSEVQVHLIRALRALAACAPEVYGPAAEAFLQDIRDGADAADLSDWDRTRIAQAFG